MRFTLYFLDDRALVFRRVELDCVSDADAIAQLMALADGEAMEIWRGIGHSPEFERLF